MSQKEHNPTSCKTQHSESTKISVVHTCQTQTTSCFVIVCIYKVTYCVFHSTSSSSSAPEGLRSVKWGCVVGDHSRKAPTEGDLFPGMLSAGSISSSLSFPFPLLSAALIGAKRCLLLLLLLSPHPPCAGSCLHYLPCPSTQEARNGLREKQNLGSVSCLGFRSF